MKKRALLGVVVGAVLLALSAAATMWMLRGPEPTWTTDSYRALAELEAAFEDRSKRYQRDAILHLERALELDPDFVMAKLGLAIARGGREGQRLLDEVRASDLEELSSQERFLVEYELLCQSGEVEQAAEAADAYLARHPRDPHALIMRCDASWRLHQFEDAATCYERMTELYPNWVEAQNRLGYLAMARGRFAEAEERFRTYRFIAPDQANPYDSLGEMLIFVGRHEEAEEALLQALEIKPDFCASYQHLVDLYLAAGQAESLERLWERVDETPCASALPRNRRCSAEMWMTFLRGDLEGAWELSIGKCQPLLGYDMLTQRLALLFGMPARADAAEEILEKAISTGKVHGDIEAYRARLLHMKALAKLVSGDVEGAVAGFEQADASLTYWGTELARLKLFNRAHLLLAYEAAGKVDQAARIRQEIAAVNVGYLASDFLPDREALLRLARGEAPQEP